MIVKACLNGTRTRADHPRCPVTPEELAAEGLSAVNAGAAALHVHPRDRQGNETLDGRFVGAALVAIRDCFAVPIGVTTGAWFLPDPQDRLRSIERWDELPDFASVNFHEPGARDIALALLDRGVGVEAGIWHAHAAIELARSGLGPRCLRVLLEPMGQTRAEVTATVAEIERDLADTAPGVPRLLHGFDAMAWPVLRLAAEQGYDMRIGLEDTLRLPDGSDAEGNASLVEAAVTNLVTAGISITGFRGA